LRPESRPINGFTLIEVVVALAVFSLAALALIRLSAFSVRTGGDVIAHELVWQVARNRAVEIISDPVPPVLGKSEGSETNGGQSFAWQQEAKATDDARFVRVDITVIGKSGGRAALSIAKARP
jgi:general secretion pathway protein I